MNCTPKVRHKTFGVFFMKLMSEIKFIEINIPYLADLFLSRKKVPRDQINSFTPVGLQLRFSFLVQWSAMVSAVKPI